VNKRFIAIIGVVAAYAGIVAAQPVVVVGTGDPNVDSPGSSRGRRSRWPGRPDGTFLFRQAPGQVV
jgi:hypothetical protein